MRCAGPNAPRTSSRASALKLIDVCAAARSERPAILRGKVWSCGDRNARSVADAVQAARTEGSRPVRSEGCPDFDASSRAAGSPLTELAEAHGRATTRAVHPVISKTVSRPAVADRLRIGFDKTPPSPLFALVAALAQSGRNFSIGRPPFAVRAASATQKPNGSDCPPATSPVKPHAVLRRYRKNLPYCLSAKGGPPKTRLRNKYFKNSSDKKMAIALHPGVAFRQRFVTTLG